MYGGAVSRNMVLTSALSVMLLLTTPFMPALGLASLPATDFKPEVTAQDFRLLAQATTSGQGGKRALLQSTAFSENFFRILEPILEGNSGTTVVPAAVLLPAAVHTDLTLSLPCADAEAAASAIASASEAGDTTAIADVFSLSFAYGYAVPATYAAATAIQQGSAFTCNNFAASAYISALSNAIAISSTEAAAQAIYAAFTLGW